jgi:hypothetical protein
VDVRRAAPAASWSAAGRESVQRADTRCREICFVGEEKRFQLCFAAHASPSGLDKRASTDCKSASAKKYPARQVTSPSGVGHRMCRLLIVLRYPISIGRDARLRFAGFVQTQRL